MNVTVRNATLLIASLTALVWVAVDRLAAQTFTTLYSFSGGTEGSSPQRCNLVLSSNTLYGTTVFGGSFGSGTLFAINTDGTGFRLLHTFTGGSDGAAPQGGLTLSGNILYGTTGGTVFSLRTDGTGFATLYTFTAGSDGAQPMGGLVLSGNTLFGTAQNGGCSADGTVFAVNTDGTGFTTLYCFGGASDGATPLAPLLLSGSTLFGTTVGGYTFDRGTVFDINTDGTGFSALHNFTGGTDGSYPNTGLTLSSNTLYGATYGNVFAVNQDGAGFSTLHAFIVGTNQTNPDGTNPNGLTLSGDTLYGSCQSSGPLGNGTIFQLNTDGSGFKVLYSFPASDTNVTSVGVSPSSTLVLSGQVLYGTTDWGGAFGRGSVFSLTLPSSLPQLAISRSSLNLILTWPTNFTGFTLQSTTNLSSPVWITNLPAPAIVNGQFIVTNPISGTQQFFRLSQ